MIKVLFEKDVYIPVIVCDICQQRITDVKNAAAVNPSNFEEGSLNELIHVHKGNCHDLADVRFTTSLPPSWEELSDHLYYLSYNLGLTPKWFAKRDKQFKESGG